MADKNMLAVDEWLKTYGPMFEQTKEQIRPCIQGLTSLAASLATENRTDDVAMLRGRVDAMSAFWFGGDEDHAAQFDKAVAEAKATGQCNQLSEEQRLAILNGIRVNNDQMARDLDDEQTLEEFDALSEWLGSRLSAEAQIDESYGGMTFE